MSNYTNLTDEYSIIIEEISVADRIIAGMLWILYTFPGNALMFGMVQFDRLGGDPLKRRITDRVSALNFKIKNEALIKGYILI